MQCGFSSAGKSPKHELFSRILPPCECRAAKYLMNIYECTPCVSPCTVNGSFFKSLPVYAKIIACCSETRQRAFFTNVLWHNTNFKILNTNNNNGTNSKP